MSSWSSTDKIFNYFEKLLHTNFSCSPGRGSLNCKVAISLSSLPCIRGGYGFEDLKTDISVEKSSLVFLRSPDFVYTIHSVGCKVKEGVTPSLCTIQCAEIFFAGCSDKVSTPLYYTLKKEKPVSFTKKYFREFDFLFKYL